MQMLATLLVYATCSFPPVFDFNRVSAPNYSVPRFQSTPSSR